MIGRGLWGWKFSDSFAELLLLRAARCRSGSPMAQYRGTFALRTVSLARSSSRSGMRTALWPGHGSLSRIALCGILLLGPYHLSCICLPESVSPCLTRSGSHWHAGNLTGCCRSPPCSCLCQPGSIHPGRGSLSRNALCRCPLSCVPLAGAPGAP